MYIVTGGAGFIGSAMIWRLNEAGIDDILVVDNLASSEKWRNLVNRRYRDYVHRDEFRRMVLEGRAPQKVEAIIHMGACSSTTERNADFLMDNNLHYSQMVCRYALEQGARLINASSAATYGDGSHGFSDSLLTTLSLRPLNMYGYSKQMFDLWAYRENLLKSIASVKFFNVYGPNEYHKGEMKSVACKAFTELRETGSLRLFKSDRPQYPDGGQMRDFVYVKDCVNVMVLAAGASRSQRHLEYRFGQGPHVERSRQLGVFRNGQDPGHQLHRHARRAEGPLSVLHAGGHGVAGTPWLRHSVPQP